MHTKSLYRSPHARCLFPFHPPVECVGGEGVGGASARFLRFFVVASFWFLMLHVVRAGSFFVFALHVDEHDLGS